MPVIDAGADLEMPEGGVDAVSCEEAFVVAALPHHAIFQHHDLDGVADGGKAVGDDDLGAARRSCRQRIEQSGLGTGSNPVCPANRFPFPAICFLFQLIHEMIS